MASWSVHRLIETTRRGASAPAGAGPAGAAPAADAPGEAVRTWDRLGYPRRALRLHAAATAMVELYDGDVPRTEGELLEHADAVLVQEDGKPIGVLTRQDLLAFLAAS